MSACMDARTHIVEILVQILFINRGSLWPVILDGDLPVHPSRGWTYAVKEVFHCCFLLGALWGDEVCGIKK